MIKLTNVYLAIQLFNLEIYLKTSVNAFKDTIIYMTVLIILFAKLVNIVVLIVLLQDLLHAPLAIHHYKIIEQ